MSVTPKDLWSTVKELLIEQYRGNLREEIESGTYVDDDGVERHYELPGRADNRLQGVLKAVIDELLQPVDDAAVDIGRLADVSQAEGEWLDVLGKLAGLQRYYQESDRDFRVRVEAALASDNAGTPDNVIYNAAILSGDPHPQYMDEAPATFLVYDGPRPVGLRGEPILTEGGQEILTEGGDTIETEPVPAWEQGGHQLSRSQVRKLAPAGVLGLPGAALQDAEGNYIVDADGKLILLVADDSNIEREVLLADNLGNIVITPQSVPVRVKLTGPTVPTIPVIETEWNGVPVDAVRIKDLPDAQYDSAYMVRDNDTAGTTKINESEVGIQMAPTGTNTLKFYRRGPST